MTDIKVDMATYGRPIYLLLISIINLTNSFITKMGRPSEYDGDLDNFLKYLSASKVNIL